MEVYIITMPELGWDCVVGIYDCSSVAYEELRNRFPEDQYVIHEGRYVQSEIEE